jgi:hypothetical protein
MLQPDDIVGIQKQVEITATSVKTGDPRVTSERKLRVLLKTEPRVGFKLPYIQIFHRFSLAAARLISEFLPG